MSHGPRVARAVARRTWRATLRRPVVLTFSFGQPILWMIFFGFLFDRAGFVGEDGTSYRSFLVAGIGVMTVLFGASQSGISIVRDLHTGFLPRMLATPASRAWILAGKIFADATRVVAQAVVVVIIGALVGAKLDVSLGALVPAVLAVALFGATFACVSVLIASLTRAQESMAVFVHLVNMPIFFTSTALVPSRQMPDWLATLSAWNPLTLAVDGLRSALLGGSSDPAIAALPVLFGLTGVAFAASTVALSTVARRRPGS